MRNHWQHHGRGAEGAAQREGDRSSANEVRRDAPMRIAPFNLRDASGQEYAALAAFRNRIRAEHLPDDPPIPLNEYMRRWRNTSPHMNMSTWVVWNEMETSVVASGSLEFLRTGENTEVLDFRIAVLPEYRRRGLGRRLLALVAEVSSRENRRLMFARTNGRIEAGEEFMTRLGATRGLESHTNQLVLSKHSLETIRQWQKESAERAAGFELLFWAGAYPEEHLMSIAALHDVVNHAPRGDLEVKSTRFTPAHLREIERQLVVNGTQRWTLYAREKATDLFTGFTEIFWHPNRPAYIQQGFTGVFPQYRNKGLGRWLKVAMLEKIKCECPQSKFVRTGNADANAAMLRINRELGFVPYSSQCTWQVETKRALEYLAAYNGN